MSADLYPEEAKHGALVRGFSVVEARSLAASLTEATEAVEGPGVTDGHPDYQPEWAPDA